MFTYISFTFIYFCAFEHFALIFWIQNIFALNVFLWPMSVCLLQPGELK